MLLQLDVCRISASPGPQTDLSDSGGQLLTESSALQPVPEFHKACAQGWKISTKPEEPQNTCYPELAVLRTQLMFGYCLPTFLTDLSYCTITCFCRILKQSFWVLCYNSLFDRLLKQSFGFYNYWSILRNTNGRYWYLELRLGAVMFHTLCSKGTLNGTLEGALKGTLKGSFKGILPGFLSGLVEAIPQGCL